MAEIGYCPAYSGDDFIFRAESRAGAVRDLKMDRGPPEPTASMRGVTSSPQPIGKLHRACQFSLALPSLHTVLYAGRISGGFQNADYHWREQRFFRRSLL
ncbi:MAG: hypothetical protein ACPH5G_00075 [Pseudooceanicola atlanticus]